MENYLIICAEKKKNNIFLCLEIEPIDAFDKRNYSEIVMSVDC